MTDYNFRPAIESDFPSIRKLIHVGGINPTGLDWRRFVVAVLLDGQVVGCGQIKPHGKEVLELASIAVEPAYRSQGIASALIEQLIASAPRPLYLMCRSPLGPLYEKFGFQAIPIDEMPTYFRRMSRLAGLVESLALMQETLLVMKLQ